ncbi:hypothetical protein ALO64_100518 [Pseudomonas meliae]|uniref:Uncharacterized protein n=1 Tax=Pseudomonas meliae TaxID=86176 RepID=A0A0P9UZN6_9PSED|nr:hypothetical protein ALO64_100518 [Pseudomonas meliae]
MAEDCGSELVRERAGMIAENASAEIPSSRTGEASPLRSHVLAAEA